MNFLMVVENGKPVSVEDHEVFDRVQAGNEVLLLAPDGSATPIVRAAMRQAPVQEVQILVRTVKDATDRLVLTEQGWRRLDSLKVMDRAVIRCGSKEPSMVVAGVTLGEKRAPRIVEKSHPAAGQFMVYDFVCEPDLGYEANGVIVKTPG
jgi:hypothetical protein